MLPVYRSTSPHTPEHDRCFPGMLLSGSSPDPVGNGECRDHAGLALVTVGRGSLPAMRYAIVIILFLVR